MNPINLLAAAAMLAYAAYLDFRTREVPDRLWIGFCTLAAVLLVLETISRPRPIDTLYELASIGLVSIIAYALYAFGFFGGADAKGLVTVSFLLPLYPGAATIHPVTGLIVLTNGVMLSITLPLAYLIYNSFRILRREPIFDGFEQEGFPRKLLAALLGTRVGQVRENQFRFSLEQTTPAGKTFTFSLLGDVEFLKNQRDVWVTPGIPLLVFIALGFLVMLVTGDLLYYLLRWLFPITSA